MKRIITLCIPLISITFKLYSVDLKSFLSENPDILYQEIYTPKGFKEAYKIKIKQPIDHSDTVKGYFYQTVFLLHRNKKAPTVIATEGYHCYEAGAYETTELLQANQIQVEHRFFGSSKPEPVDYQYLNLRQATADLHHINELFREFYKGTWASTGISKGGQTTIFYKYFYPNDVSASVPLVAPFNLSIEDKRVYNFFDTVGTKECRDKIAYAQERIFLARDTIIPVLDEIVEQSGYSYTYLDLEEAFEFAILEYPFSFWQWGAGCSSVPGQGESIGEFIKHVFTVSDIGFFGDRSMETYGAHYYQAATEMGYYGYEIDNFKHYIKALPNDKNPLATFPPNKMETTFNDSLAHVVFDWLKNEGNNMIYIYGAIDTWSATSVPYSDKTNSLWFMMKGENHRTARIRNLEKGQYKKLKKTLKTWM